jgi:RimJ/RimL family protein N-acetyltransferase
MMIDTARAESARRMNAETFPANAASQRVLEKCGFTKVGEVERDLPLRGGKRRLFVHSLDLSTCGSAF